jgi:hypothetical protein
MRFLLLVTLGIIFVSGAGSMAQAYFGPGAGITMLGALWAVILAIVLALGGVLLWPIRALILRRRYTRDKGLSHHR